MGESERIVSEPEVLSERFLDWFSQRGYGIVPPAPLTATDESLTFVNSTIAPYRDTMLRGETIQPLVQFQPCLRSTGADPWLSWFRMVGVVAMAERLRPVVTDLVAFLRRLPWLDVGTMLLLADRSDDDLVEAWLRADPDTVHVPIRGETHETTTRWSFGAGSALLGRGLTLVYEHPDTAPCSDTCAGATTRSATSS